MDPKLLSSALLGALVLWALYRRVRRTIGRQLVSAPRLSLRAGILALLGLLLLRSLWRQPALLEMMGGGILVGAALALLGLRYTRFERVQGQRFYTPHTYIGVLVVALVVGRLVFRYVTIYGGTQAAASAATAGNPLAAYQQSPLTSGLLGLLIGYYVLYNVGVLMRARNLSPGDSDDTALSG